jgi:hypothetical protein
VYTKRNVLFFRKRQKQIEQRKKKTTLVFLYVYFFLVAILGISLEFTHPQFTIAFLAIPATYLASKIEYAYKIKLETLIYGFFCTFLIDHIAHVSGAWYVPPNFGIRILDSFPIEEFLWAFSFVLLILSLYEYIFDQDKSKEISKLFQHFTNLLSGFFFALITIYFLLPQALNIPYFYAVLICIFAFITLWGFYKYPKIIGKISKLAAYFFVPALIYELSALKLGHWEFTKGMHIGYVELLSYTFPFEELLFWILTVTALLVVHEAFADNQK